MEKQERRLSEETVKRLGIATGKSAALCVELPPHLPQIATARSLYQHLTASFAEFLSAEMLPSFMEGVARGIIEAHADIPRVLPLLSKLPGEPRFETTSSFTSEELKEGKVLRTREAGYRALNEAAVVLIRGLIKCFRERSSRGTPNKS
jgi:hypothetical protein